MTPIQELIKELEVQKRNIALKPEDEFNKGVVAGIGTSILKAKKMHEKEKEVMEEECIKNLTEGINDIINSENSGLSAEQRLKEIQNNFNTKEK